MDEAYQAGGSGVKQSDRGWLQVTHSASGEIRKSPTVKRGFLTPWGIRDLPPQRPAFPLDLIAGATDDIVYLGERRPQFKSKSETGTHACPHAVKRFGIQDSYVRCVLL